MCTCGKLKAVLLSPMAAKDFRIWLTCLNQRNAKKNQNSMQQTELKYEKQTEYLVNIFITCSEISEPIQY